MYLMRIIFCSNMKKSCNTHKVLVVGNYGYYSNELDGQTVKSRNIYDMLHRNNDNVSLFDTDSFKISKLKVFKLFKAVLFSKNIVIIPADNFLKNIFPFIFIISKILRKSIICIPVGGWWVWFLKDKKYLRFMLRHITAIMPQTQKDVEGLKQECGLDNVFYFPNFRLSDFVPSPTVREGIMKIVFFARINKRKGLDVVFYVADLLKKNNLSDRITIDFYGQVKEEDKEYFFSNVDKYNFVTYNGALDPKDINTTLAKYDVLLFPTRYINDEGFPGTILDGYMSGLPVVASNWCHSKEFVNDGFCGYICDINNLDEFYDKIIYLFEHPECLLQMKHNAFEESKKYSADNAYSIISSYIV